MADDRQVVDPPYRLRSTRVLLDDWRAGDDAALDALLDRYYPRLERFAHVHVPRGARGLMDTGDFVQETVLRTLKRLKAFEPRREGAFFSYLCEALRNLIRDEFVRLAHRPPAESVPDDPPDPGPPLIVEVIGWERYERYRRCREKLPARKREAIVLRFELGFTLREVVEALGLNTTSAANMLIRRAVEDLAECMHESD